MFHKNISFGTNRIRGTIGNTRPERRFDAACVILRRLQHLIWTSSRAGRLVLNLAGFRQGDYKCQALQATPEFRQVKSGWVSDCFWRGVGRGNSLFRPACAGRSTRQVSGTLVKTASPVAENKNGLGDAVEPMLAAMYNAW